MRVGRDAFLSRRACGGSPEPLPKPFLPPEEGNSTFPTAPLARWKQSGPRQLRERNPRRLAGVTRLKIQVRLFIVKAGLIIKMFIKHLAALNARNPSSIPAGFSA